MKNEIYCRQSRHVVFAIDSWEFARRQVHCIASEYIATSSVCQDFTLSRKTVDAFSFCVTCSLILSSCSIKFIRPIRSYLHNLFHSNARKACLTTVANRRMKSDQRPKRSTDSYSSVPFTSVGQASKQPGAEASFEYRSALLSGYATK